MLRVHKIYAPKWRPQKLKERKHEQTLSQNPQKTINWDFQVSSLCFWGCFHVFPTFLKHLIKQTINSPLPLQNKKQKNKPTGEARGFDETLWENEMARLGLHREKTKAFRLQRAAPQLRCGSSEVGKVRKTFGTGCFWYGRLEGVAYCCCFSTFCFMDEDVVSFK